MDLWQVFKQSPLWFQVIFIVGEIASLYAAATLLLPAIIRWCRMIFQRIVNLINLIKENRIWKNHRPSLTLLEVPSKIEKNLGQSVDVWRSQFKIRLQTRDDSRVVQINLAEVTLLVLQGKGMRASKNELKTKYEDSNTFELSPSGSGSVAEKTIIVEAGIYHSDLISSINTEKLFRWEIRNINARVHPLSFRSLEVIIGDSK
jgi:hypothetical protein